jgi:hypothetical protein
MKPPTFSKAEDPLEAEAWIKAIEAKFSALQLRGEALMWWDHFKTMQQGRAVTWNDFKQAFKSHHIPKGLMDRKMRELLALRQGSDTVYRYAQKFNSLCQYGGHHVDTDAKKMERFRDGLQSLMHPHVTSVVAIVSTVVNQGITSVIAPSPSRSIPNHRIKV